MILDVGREVFGWVNRHTGRRVCIAYPNKSKFEEYSIMQATVYAAHKKYGFEGRIEFGKIKIAFRDKAPAREPRPETSFHAVIGAPLFTFRFPYFGSRGLFYTLQNFEPVRRIDPAFLMKERMDMSNPATLLVRNARRGYALAQLVK